MATKVLLQLVLGLLHILNFHQDLIMHPLQEVLVQEQEPDMAGVHERIRNAIGAHEIVSVVKSIQLSSFRANTKRR